MKEEGKTGRKVLKITAAVLGGLIALYCAVYLVMTVATGDSLPMPLGFGSAVVLTGSMEPNLRVNDLIFVAKAKNYRVGDIVVYRTSGTPVVHRIVEIDEESGVLVTKGDANNAEDDPITLSRVKGKMVFRIPLIGFIPRFIRTVPGMIITLVLLFTLLFLSMRTHAQADEEETKKRTLEEEIEKLRRQTGLTKEESEKLAKLSDTELEIEKLKKQIEGWPGASPEEAPKPPENNSK